MVRDMGGVSWRELQDLPAYVYRLWQAFRRGEGETRREQAEQAQRRDSVKYV